MRGGAHQGPTGTIKYGISISTITVEHTLEQVEAMSEAALRTADQISRALGYTPEGSTAPPVPRR